MATQTGSARLLKDVMTRNVETITPSAGVQEAAQKMKTLDIGAIPVCDGSRLRGMLTDRDIVVRVVAERRDVNMAKAEDAMSADLVYCFEDQDVDEAARIMGEKQIRRLPIVSRDKQLVGIVSLGDVAVKTSAPSDHALKEVSKPSPTSQGTGGTSTGIPDPKASPKQYNEAMKKYDTPDGNQ
ncbi:MAG TPA: CBS domain-containing protein [Nitrospiraceae bacterium]|nr:CBS domain-containing protein [Nitrospiraceae bacterium]